MADLAAGVAHMHNKGIAHWDLKVENVLMGNDHKFKIADYGSATRKEDFLLWKEVDPKNVARKYESFEKNTTLMYRPPEMIDRYAKKDVDYKADIWMLGCILYTLLFAKQPFMDKQALAILNGQY